MEGGKLQNEERNFFFKTTEICFGSTKMGIFHREKAFHASGKMTPPPKKKIPLIPLHAHTFGQCSLDLFVFKFNIFWKSCIIV